MKKTIISGVLLVLISLTIMLSNCSKPNNYMTTPVTCEECHCQQEKHNWCCCNGVCKPKCNCAKCTCSP